MDLPSAIYIHLGQKYFLFLVLSVCFFNLSFVDGSGILLCIVYNLAGQEYFLFLASSILFNSFLMYMFLVLAVNWYLLCIVFLKKRALVGIIILPPSIVIKSYDLFDKTVSITKVPSQNLSKFPFF